MIKSVQNALPPASDHKWCIQTRPRPGHGDPHGASSQAATQSRRPRVLLTSMTDQQLCRGGSCPHVSKYVIIRCRTNRCTQIHAGRAGRERWAVVGRRLGDQRWPRRGFVRERTGKSADKQMQARRHQGTLETGRGGWPDGKRKDGRTMGGRRWEEEEGWKWMECEECEMGLEALQEKGPSKPAERSSSSSSTRTQKASSPSEHSSLPCWARKGVAGASGWLGPVDEARLRQVKFGKRRALTGPAPTR